MDRENTSGRRIGQCRLVDEALVTQHLVLVPRGIVAVVAPACKRIPNISHVKQQRRLIPAMDERCVISVSFGFQWADIWSYNNWKT